MSLKTFVIGITLTTLAVLTAGTGYLLMIQKNRIADSNASVTVESTETPESGRNGPFPKAYQRTQIEAADFSLTDQHGATVKLSTLRGRVVVLSFAFAHCSAICPTLVKSLIDSSKQFHAEVSTLIVTLDPTRDTPATLAHTASNWQLPQGMSYLSGDPQAVEQVLAAYQVPHAKDASGTINHPALVYIIDRDGRIAFTLNAPSQNWLIGAVQRAGTPGT